ncbi:MAG: type 1 glutamine amidotransferase domain-containing protein [Rubricoccaceae bacterium]
MSTPLSSFSVAILATNGFEQSELMMPKQALEDAGATVHVISPEPGSITGWDQDNWGDSVAVDKTLADASPSDYVGLVLPGGQINPDVLRVNDDALAFIKAFAETEKPIAAICHAPWLVIEAGLAEGRDMTSYTSIRTDLENAGATVHDKEVVRCENGPFPLITSRNPDDLPAFNATIIEAFSQVPEMA